MSDDQSTDCVLEQTEEQFHILVDSVEEYAIYMLDPVGNVVTWNLGAQRIKQYKAHEIIGKNFASFYTAEDVAAENRSAICARPRAQVTFARKVCAFVKMDQLSMPRLS
jgi:PAS domain S-box-containing protein